LSAAKQNDFSAVGSSNLSISRCSKSGVIKRDFVIRAGIIADHKSIERHRSLRALSAKSAFAPVTLIECSGREKPMMKRKFRVLLLDDNREVLDLLKATLDQTVEVEGLSIRIEVESLHLVLEQQAAGHGYKFTEATILNLGELCDQKFDYIFSDFTFIGDSTRNEQLRSDLIRENRGVEKKDLDGFILQLKDIKDQFDNMCRAGQFNTDELIPLRDHIKSRFIDHEGSVLIYTNSPKPFENYFDTTQMPIRRNEVQNVFSKATIEPFILMHNEFSITPELEALFADPNKRKQYYSSLLSKRIESLLHHAALKHMVTAQGKLRFTNTKKAFQVLTAYGIGFGALVALAGEVIYHFLERTLSLTNKKFNLITEIEESILFNLGILVLVVVLSWFIFPRFGLRIAKKTEAEIEELT
jgi:hypothetical protein